MGRFATALILIGFSIGVGFTGEPKTLYGYVEKVTLVENNLMLSAKLDTGAKSASLSATNIEEVYENNKLFLKFTVPTKFGRFQYKEPYAGRVCIKLRAAERSKVIKSKSLKRPMVRMKVKLGDKERNILFNLTNRKRFNYPILLGRDALIAFNGIVDPAYVFLQRKAVQLKVISTHVKT